MILYHGSNTEVKEPKILSTNKALDFGPGFYTTTDLEQAKSWAVTKTKRLNKGTPIVSVYQYNNDYAQNNLNIVKFEKPNKKWTGAAHEK